jgi:hypothetical protein
MKETTGAQGKNNEPQRRRKTIEYIKPSDHLDKNKYKSIRIKKIFSIPKKKFDKY